MNRPATPSEYARLTGWLKWAYDRNLPVLYDQDDDVFIPHVTLAYKTIGLPTSGLVMLIKEPHYGNSLQGGPGETKGSLRREE